ncbi:hypothetical protein L218DRAFT_896469 [Marasmius fiardii PR-910]|nr:hypothetical protein L218DRAFT_896469 [Marasmius fiardii PR-910]
MSNEIEFYDIAGKSEGTWSPNTYKTRYLLHYKGLPYKQILVEFPDIKRVCEEIGAAPTTKNPDGSPLYTFPVIRDRSTGAVISDSLPIAEYIEKQYPNKPSSIPAGTTALHRAFDAVFQTKALGNLRPLLLPKVPEVLNEASIDFFLRTRKERLGIPLADFYPKDPVEQWKKVEADLEVVAGWFKDSEFIGGDEPVFADFVTAGWIGFARTLYGAESPEWKKLGGTFQGGRWGRLLESLKKYE